MLVAAAADKSLRSCPTLCNLRDGSLLVSYCLFTYFLLKDELLELRDCLLSSHLLSLELYNVESKGHVRYSY